MARIIEEIEKSAYYQANIEQPDIELAVLDQRDRARRGHRREGDEAQDDRRGLGLGRRGAPDQRVPARGEHRGADHERGHASAGSRSCWGVTPVLIGPSASTEELVDRVEATLIERNLALPGENVLITMAVPVGAGLQTNVLKIHQIQH